MENNKTLIGMLNDYSRISYEILSASGDDVLEEQVGALTTAINALCEKADNYGHVIDQLKSFADQCAARKEQWQAGERAAKNSIENLKARMRYVLSSIPDQSLQGEEFRFFLSKPSESVEIEAEKIPKEYMKTQISYVPDREKIEADLRAGKEIPGAKIAARQSMRQGRPK